MNKILKNRPQLWVIVLETAAVIVVCTLIFVGITRTAYSAVVNQSQTIPGTQSLQTLNKTPAVPAGYIKADYQVKLGQYSEQPGAKDMSKEQVAELGAQDLWRIFELDLNGKTIEMTYYAATSTSPRAEWSGIVKINDRQSYFFNVDAVTGEHRNTRLDEFWEADFEVGPDQSLINNHHEYDALARAVAEKKLLVLGKVASVEYYGQGSSSNAAGARNADIMMRVKSEDGVQAQLYFSRYNRQFLGVDYDCWVKEVNETEKQMMKEARAEFSKKIMIDDQKMEGAQESRGVRLKAVD